VSNVGYVAALGAGVISFASPCVLPVVPAYLSAVTGLDVAQVQKGQREQLVRIARTTSLFIAGFTVSFVVLGLTATSLGQTVVHHRLVLTRVAGLVVLTMAMALAGSQVLRAPWLYRELRFHPSASRYGPFAAPVLGLAFGLGWTPCIGPVLGSVLAIASLQGHAWRGATLGAAYGLGLGIPFLAMGLAFGHLAGVVRFIQRHVAALTFGAAVVMGVMGALLALNRMTWVTTEAQRLFRSVGLGRLVTLG